MDSFEYFGSVLEIWWDMRMYNNTRNYIRVASKDIIMLHSQTLHSLLTNIYAVQDIVTARQSCLGQSTLTPPFYQSLH